MTSVCFSPDGKTLASGSQDKSVRIWNVDSGQEIKTFSGHFDDVSVIKRKEKNIYLSKIN